MQLLYRASVVLQCSWVTGRVVEALVDVAVASARLATAKIEAHMPPAGQGGGQRKTRRKRSKAKKSRKSRR